MVFSTRVNEAPKSSKIVLKHTWESVVECLASFTTSYS